MKLMDKVWGSLGLVEPEEIEEEKQKYDEPDTKNRKLAGNVVNLPTAQKQVKVMVIEPFTFDDAQQVADYLKNRKPVVVNFENSDPEVSKRIVDFISGTTYALAGTMQKVGTHIFLCAPNNVDISFAARDENHERSGLLAWNK